MASHGHLVTAREPPWSSAAANGHTNLLVVQSAVNRWWYTAITRRGRSLVLDDAADSSGAKAYGSKLRRVCAARACGLLSRSPCSAVAAQLLLVAAEHAALATDRVVPCAMLLCGMHGCSKCWSHGFLLRTGACTVCGVGAGVSTTSRVSLMARDMGPERRYRAAPHGLWPPFTPV